MLEEALTEIPVAISQDLAAHPPAVVPGQVLADRYEVGERIGGGGMADVFRARDWVLRRNVAVKVIRPHLASDEMRRRMLREARASAAIDHPHVLQVSDFGTIGASAYLVTDLLTGMSLSDLLRLTPEHRMSWRAALTLLLPALDALDRVHQAGMVHRDLKPDNLFVHRRNERDALIVLDLGIAKVAPALSDPSGPAATESGRVLGTPAYMSPEQASGLPVDHRTDIYSIGVTLYRMLAGCLPFESQPGDQAFALMARNIYDAPRPLDEDALGLPRGLSAVVLRTLAKNPAARPQSMRALAATLASFRPGAVGAASATPLERSARLYRVGRLTANVGLLAALIASAGPLAADIDAIPTPPDEPHAPALPVASIDAIPTPPDEPHAPALPVAGVPAPDPGAPAVPAPDPRAPSAAPDPADATPPASSTPPRQPAARSPGRAPPRPPEALTSVLAAVTPAMQACIAGRGALDRRPLTVRLSLGTDGRVTGASIPDREHTDMLGRCALPRLLQLRFTPGPRQDLVHSFPVGGGR